MKYNTHAAAVLPVVGHEDCGRVRRRVTERLPATVVEAGQVLRVYLRVVTALESHQLARVQTVRDVCMRYFYPQRLLHATHQPQVWEVCSIHCWDSTVMVSLATRVMFLCNSRLYEYYSFFCISRRVKL